MNYIKELYNWVLSWAEKPSGPAALGLISTAEASFFPIPPDVLLIPLALGKREKAFKFALICSIGSIIGACIGYGIGQWAWWTTTGSFSDFAQLFFDHIPGFSHEGFEKIKALYDEYNFMIVFTAGFTPIPFKLFTISAGAFHVNFPLFIFASVISRSTRFFLVAGLINKYGDPIREFIEKYFNLLALGFTALLIGGFIVIKILL